MKSFYASLAVFATLLILIICNSLFVRQTTAQLKGFIEQLPSCEEARTSFEQAKGFWESRKKLVAFTAPHKDVEALNTYLIQIGAAIQTKDPHSFEQARALAIDAADRLHESEEFSLDNLL